MFVWNKSKHVFKIQTKVTKLDFFFYLRIYKGSNKLYILRIESRFLKLNNFIEKKKDMHKKCIYFLPLCLQDD